MVGPCCQELGTLGPCRVMLCMGTQGWRQAQSPEWGQQLWRKQGEYLGGVWVLSAPRPAHPKQGTETGQWRAGAGNGAAAALGKAQSGWRLDSPTASHCLLGTVHREKKAARVGMGCSPSCLQ